MSQAKQHSAGWYAGAAVFWLLSAWIITVGLSSIIPQIFHPEASHAAGTGSCAAQLRALEGELLDRTSSAIARAPQRGERDMLTEWLARWDDRLLAAQPDCTKEELAAWDELSRLRHGMRSLVDRFDQEQAPRVRKLDALVGALPDTQAP